MVQCDKILEVTMATKSLGETVQMVLSSAKRADRVTVGFSDAIKLLSKTPEEAQFCFLAEPKLGDAATHMNEVLLQAFCYEHGIYIIKVDNGHKLAHILEICTDEVACVLIRKPNSVDGTINSDAVNAQSTLANKFDGSLSSNSIEEDILVNFCETSWYNDNYDIIKLPES